MSNGRHLDPNRPKSSELRPLIRAIYATPQGGTGCCLHVVTDDDNWDSTAFVLEYARTQEAKEPGRHTRCVQAAEMMIRMTRTQIAKACTGWERT